MVMCFVPLCRHYSERKTCRFFCFPADQELKRKWITLIRRETEPTKYSLVCSCHFENADRKNLPTLFLSQTGVEKRKVESETPEQRKRVLKKTPTPQKQSHAIQHITKSLEKTKLTPPEPLAEILETSNAHTLKPGTSGEGTSASSSRPSSRSVSRLSEVFLETENYFLKEDNRRLKEQLQQLKGKFSFAQIANKEGLILLYTGIPSTALFKIILETMEGFKLHYYAGWTVAKYNRADQLLMTLMKLRLNPPHVDLGVRFGCSSALVANTVMTWLYALHDIFFKQLMKTIPSKERNLTCLPSAFTTFTACRIILDCTELYSVVPKNLEKQRLTYSHYKHRNTWKVLIGVAPNGVITYVSQAYPGSVSDQKIVEHCGIFQQMKEGDLILADKGFLIRNILPPGVNLNIPPFLSTGQFTEEQVYETERIAKARIHVERAIRRLKCFHILDRIPHHYIKHISVIVQTCAALTNFQYPLIKEVEQYYA